MFDPLDESYGRFVHSPPYIFDRRFAAAAARYRPFAFHAHDLPTSLIALQAAAKTGAVCVCDFHEWYSENVSWSARLGRYVPHPTTTKAFMQYGERLALHHATAIVTVCDSISAELSDGRYGIKREIDVIRNIPPLQRPEAGPDLPSLRMQLGVGADTFIVLWQGGVGPTRMIEPIIAAFAEVEGAVLAIRGPAIRQFGPGYEALARKLGIADRVFCLDEVPSNRVVEAASTADAGVWSLPNLCKNFYYALPNKVFEYLAAGIPILGADYPEVRRLIDRYEVGVTFDPYDSHSIATAISRLVADRQTTKRFSENTRAALEDMRADQEWTKLARLYDRLRAECTTAAVRAA